MQVTFLPRETTVKKDITGKSGYPFSCFKILTSNIASFVFKFFMLVTWVFEIVVAHTVMLLYLHRSM